MEKVVFEKDGLWAYKSKRNEVTDEWEELKLRPERPWTLLRSQCEIAEGVTLGDIFEAVDNIPDLKDFISQYSWCREIDAFHAQAREERPPEDPDNLEYLEVHWWTQSFRYKGVLDFDCGPDFHGIGSKDAEHQFYSVSYSPMYHLAHLPVKLNDQITIYRENLAGCNDPKAKVLYQGVKSFTLLEVLDAIYWDISFMGGPEDNKAFIEEMNERTEEILSGKAELVPFEEVFPEEEEEDDGGYKPPTCEHPENN